MSACTMQGATLHPKTAVVQPATGRILQEYNPTQHSGGVSRTDYFTHGEKSLHGEQIRKVLIRQHGETHPRKGTHAVHLPIYQLDLQSVNTVKKQVKMSLLRYAITSSTSQYRSA